MDEDSTWYGSRLQTRPHCVRRNPVKGAQHPPPLFWPVSTVATVAISATVEFLLKPQNIYTCGRVGVRCYIRSTITGVSMSTSTDSVRMNGIPETLADIFTPSNLTLETSSNDSSYPGRRRCQLTDVVWGPMPTEQLPTPDVATRHKQLPSQRTARDHQALHHGLSSQWSLSINKEYSLLASLNNPINPQPWLACVVYAGRATLQPDACLQNETVYRMTILQPVVLV